MSTDNKTPDNAIEATIEGYEDYVPAGTPATDQKPATPPETPKVETVEAKVDVPAPRNGDPVHEKLEDGANFPEAALTNREAWLTEAARRLCAEPSQIGKAIILSVGFGKGGTRGKRAWSVADNAEGTGYQVFIRPTVHEAKEAGIAVREALRSLNVDKARKVTITSWPAYPQPEVDGKVEKQTTRQIKCFCVKCGFLFRTSDRWIPDGDANLNCPSPECAGVKTVSVCRT